jgi:hypothetical protein
MCKRQKYVHEGCETGGRLGPKKIIMICSLFLRGLSIAGAQAKVQSTPAGRVLGLWLGPKRGARRIVERKTQPTSSYFLGVADKESQVSRGRASRGGATDH